MEAVNKTGKKPNTLGLYLNFPFCPVKCHYCSFGSRLFHRETVDRYMAALKKEIRHYGEDPLYRERGVDTVYLGGGTPTLIADELPGLLDEIKTHFQVAPSVETTLEAYPSGMSAESFSRLKEGGFNRISFGVQSFLDEDLTFFNRDHTAQDVYQAFNQARQAGFKNISLDLIYGPPGQTLARWEENLTLALDLEPEHLSVYGLTLEDKTYFDYLKDHGKFIEADDGLQGEMYLAALRRLKSRGYEQYEVSNFARSGFECRHNLYYWTQGNFLGLGATASSYIEGTHFSNISSIDGYIRKINEEGSAMEHSETLDPEGRFKEGLIFGLRKCSGITLSDFGPEYEDYLEKYRIKLKKLVGQGFLKNDHQDVFSLTDTGLLFSDHISMTLS
jgi:oxygen-independent coproporphyrinogen-3 oxidase